MKHLVRKHGTGRRNARYIWVGLFVSFLVGFTYSVTIPGNVAYAASIVCSNGKTIQVDSPDGNGSLSSADYDAACKRTGNEGYGTNPNLQNTTPPADSTNPTNNSTNTSSSTSGGSGDLQCAILPQTICDAADAEPDTSDPNNVNVKPTGLFLLLTWVLTILTAVVGIAAIGTIIYAGIMYASAGDDSGMVSKAKTLIRDVVIGVVAYGLMVVALNWLVPGGIIG
ncbi:MAG: hypothetical protein WBP12_04270 [Candidatus Saccharimonas sp.]